MKKLIISVVALVTTICVAIGFTYAWFNVVDRANNFSFQIAKIDSTVSIYKGIDGNFNGIPDAVTPANADNDAEFDFELIGTVFAQSSTNSASIEYSTSVTNAQPTMPNTFKVMLENKGDVSNVIALSFDNYSYPDDYAETKVELTSDNIKLLSSLSITVGGRLGEDGNLNPISNTGSNEPIAIKKVFLQDYITLNGSTYSWNNASILSEDDNLHIDGTLTGNASITEIWLQYTIEPYENLERRALESGKSVYLTSEEYQQLQGKSMIMPVMTVAFQVNVANGDTV